MNDPQPQETQHGGLASPWRILEIIARNRRAIIWYPLIAALIVAVFSLMVPEHYAGRATILPPEQDFQTVSLQSLALGELGMGGGMALPFMATPSDILSAIIKSRRVLGVVVDSLNLVEIWEMPSRVAAIRRLEKATSVSVDLTGVVSVRVVADDPAEAVELTNALVSSADRINRQIMNIRARNTREFIEERLADTRAALREAAAELEEFQRTHKTISIDDELAALVQNAAKLNAQLTADEIELSVLRKNMSSQNPRVAMLEQRIAETRRHLQEMEHGNDSTGTFLSTGLENAPRLALELAGKMRQVKIEETLVELLSSQYESARIQEMQDTPTISVLDFAGPDAPRVAPRRSFLVVASYGSALAVMIALTFLEEYFAVMRARRPDQYERIRNVLALLRRDGLGLKKQN